MRLSELTPADLRELRVLAAIELAYPVQSQVLGERRASVILSKYKNLMASRESSPSISGVKA